MCVLLKDDEIKTINSREELQEYLDFRKTHDKWFISPINLMQVFTKSSSELINAFKKRTGSIISDIAIQDCAENGTNMFLKFHTEINGQDKKGVVPLRYTAIRSLLDRAKIGGFSLYNEEEDAGIEVLPLQEKANIINKCLSLYAQSAKVLYRDEKISAIMSGQYAVLAEKDIVEAVEGCLKNNFPKAEFLTGSVSHEFFRMEYALNADEIEEDILMTLNDNGIAVDRVKAMLGIFTSDIGSAAATVYSYLDLDGQKMYYGKPFAIKHIGQRTGDDIAKSVNKLYSLFQNNPEDFKAMSETVIENPAGCLRSIAKEFELPKKYSMAAATALEATEKATCTAYEIFWYLNDIVRRFDEEKKDMYRSLKLQETVAETVKINFKRFDKPFEWARGESSEEAA